MYTRSRFYFKDLLLWTRWEILWFLAWALAVTVFYEVLGLRWLQLPWTPIALVGTAVAFLIGFQSNAAYGRIWEARKIWGGIVNTSRSLTMMVLDTVTNEYADQQATEDELKEQQRILVYRHIAWLTALRHAMRTVRPWEILQNKRTNREWNEVVHIPERERTIDADLAPLLSSEEAKEVLSKTNRPAAILKLQSSHLRKLKERGLIWEFSFLELEALLVELFTLQGKSERIKNFPYPRHYSTIGHYFVWVFVILLPFGVVPEFSAKAMELVGSFPKVAPYFVWLAVPFSALVSWVFQTMQRIGITGENPFEGTVNDVPISTMSRGIEVDLREMLNEGPELMPDPVPMLYNVQM